MIQAMWVQLLGWKDPEEWEMTTRFSILAWEIPYMEEPGVLPFMELRRVRHDLATDQQQHITHIHTVIEKEQRKNTKKNKTFPLTTQ